MNAFVRRQIEADPDITQRAFAVIGYSEIQAYAEAVNRAGSFDTDAVREALENFNEVPLLVGPTTFTSERHGDIWRPMVIVESEGREAPVRRAVEDPEASASGVLGFGLAIDAGCRFAQAGVYARNDRASRPRGNANQPGTAGTHEPERRGPSSLFRGRQGRRRR